MSSTPQKILGVDFTSAPSRHKAITVAHAALVGNRLTSFAEFEALLQKPRPWVGGVDFPFGLPRDLVVTLGWPPAWPQMARQNYRGYYSASLAIAWTQFCAPCRWGWPAPFRP